MDSYVMYYETSDPVMSDPERFNKELGEQTGKLFSKSALVWNQMNSTVKGTIHVQWCIIIWKFYAVNVHMNVPECTHKIIPITRSELNRFAQMLEDLKLFDPTESRYHAYMYSLT